MATKGVKKIRVSTTGREGINNTKGLRQIQEITINHPKGINPIGGSSGEISPSATSVLGGNFTYPIKSTKQLTNEFLLGTSQVEVDLLQNTYPDIYAAATESSAETIIRTFQNYLPSNISSYANNTHQDLQYAMGANFKGTFTRNIIGNNAGWYSGTVFKIKDLPNTVFKISGEIEFKVNSNPDEIYMTVVDDSIVSSGVFNYANPLFSTDKKGLGYLPFKTFSLSVGTTVESFEFMVTQSYSRVLNAPIGPSYTKTMYFENGTTDITPNEYQQWYLVFGSKKNIGNNQPYSNAVIGSNSWIKIEPITIVNADMPYGLPKPSGGGLQDLSGSLVQPPSSDFTSFNSNITPSSFSPTRHYYAGEAFFYDDFRYINLWDSQSFGSASPPSNLTEQVIAGRLSTYFITGSTNGSAWVQTDINNDPLVGWRYTSLRNTSSLVPINNSDDIYNISDFNPILDNAIDNRPSVIYCDLDYSRGTTQPLNRTQIINQTATRAIVTDSNYSNKSWSNIRYNGSRVSSNNINQK